MLKLSALSKFTLFDLFTVLDDKGFYFCWQKGSDEDEDDDEQDDDEEDEE